MAEQVEEQMDGAFGVTSEEWAGYTKDLTENTSPLPEITGKDVATFVAEMTPIIGDAMAAKEVYDELQKEDPNYYLVGALAGATAVGLIPGIGDAAAQAIKTGARKGLDFAKRIEVDPNALGSMGGNIRLKPAETATDNLLETTTRPLFREGTSSGVADFYSPTREFIESVDIPAKGLKGSELIKQLQKTPDVKSSEIELLGIDPQARYSREQLIEQYDKNNYKIVAENPTELDFKGDYRYYDAQRQELANNLDVTDYDEIIVRAQKQDGFKATGTHHTPDTVAHLRTSRVYDTDTGDKFYLIEEIQSDVVAHGSRKPRGKVTYEEAINEEATITVDQILKQYDPDVREQLSKQRGFLEEVFKSQTDRNNLDAYDEVYRKYGEDLSGHLVETTGISRTNANYIFNALDNEAYKVSELPKEELTRAISRPPIKDVNEVARIGLQTAIADALKKGNTKVVIPNLERIVAADRARPGTEKFEKMTAPGSAFHRMYVTGLQKAIDEIKKDLPDMKVGSMDINYAFRKELPSNATVLDLSAYEGKNLSRLRFGDGGLVKDNPIWKHHQMNVDNKTYVKNEDGSISTVYTTILGDGEREYLIPKVWDGEILSDEDAWDRAMSSGIDWPSAPTGEEGVRQLEQLDEELHKDMRGYAEGGEVSAMDNEMRMLMAEGGLKDDGMRVDPVSGNEIPPGSMATEVRDDIPAQLSEGEYVVPADVVKYFGVKFFEELRSEAKMGLSSMEQNGRIGGEPVSVDGSAEGGDLTPEEMAAIQDLMGMAVGGYVPQQQPPQAIGNTTYAQERQQGQMPLGFAEGGVTTDMATIEKSRTFNPADWALGSTIFTPSTAAPSNPLVPLPTAPIPGGTATIVTLYGPNGEIITLNLPADQQRYDDFIAKGWSTKNPVASQTDKELSVSGLEDTGPTVSPSGMTSKESIASAEKGLAKVNFEDPIGTGTKALEGKTTLGNIAGAIIGGLFAGPIGAQIGKAIGGRASQIGNLAEAAVNSEIASLMGYDTTSLDKAIADQLAGFGIATRGYAQNAVDAARETARDSALSVDSPFAFMDDGVYAVDASGKVANKVSDYANDSVFDKLMSDIQAEQEKINIAGMESTRPTVRPDGLTASDRTTSVSTGEGRSVDYGGKSPSRGGGTSAPSSTGTASPGARGVGSETSANGGTVGFSGNVETSGAGMTNPGGFDTSSGNWGVGPMAKGGLVSRRSKKKK